MKNSLILLLIISFTIKSFGQQTAPSQVIQVPQESIYVHQNTTFLLSGENFYYSIYCLNNETKKLSELSKVAYIELVSEGLETIFKHKINLDKGKGQGDFFVPASVPSGSYKLIAYTQWMRNGSLSNFYQNDLFIINPFQSDQSSILGSDDTAAASNYNKELATAPQYDQMIDIVLNAENFKARDQVKINLKVPNALFGAYSISVRKTNDITDGKHFSAADLNGVKKTENLLIITDSTKQYHLPELRGELLRGLVTHVSTGVPAKNVKVALSIPDRNFIFKISNTNDQGIFYFNLDEKYLNPDALIQIVGEDDDLYTYELLSPSPIDYSALKFNEFKISEQNKDEILRHSINNQIQNAYSEVWVDSLKTIEDFNPFYDKAAYEYLLDDYTRFPTVKETILEVVEQAYTRQHKGEYKLHLRVYDEDLESGLHSLLLIDGLYIEDHTVVIQSKSAKIKKISVLNESYVYGSEIFEGIISMESFNGDFLESLPSLSSKTIPLFRPLPEKEYFKRVYTEGDKQLRIPDFRSQLFWEPKVSLDKNQSAYTFYTSDLQGDFEIILEGFSNSGKAVSVKKMIHVQ